MDLQCLQQVDRTHEKNACIPEVLATGQEFERLVLGGLLDETGHAETGTGRRSLLDVAIGRAGKTGLYAEGHQTAGLRRARRTLHHGAEGFGVGNVMVGRAEQQERIDRCRQRGQGHRCSGVLGLRLQDLLHTQPCLRRHIGDQKAGLFGGHTGDGLGPAGGQRGDALQRTLQQRLVPQQRDELLGKGLARQRPQARTATPAEDDRMDHRRHANTSARASGTPCWSLADSTGAPPSSGHSMPIAGSFQAMQRSCSGA